MKILFDGQIFEAQTIGGISRYFFEIINHLKNDMIDCDVEVALRFSDNLYLQNNNFVYFHRTFPKFNFRGKGDIIRFINNNYSVHKIKQAKYDVFHPTYYNPYFTKYIGEKPFVLTVHDMIHEKFPEFFPKNDYTSTRKKELVEKATKVIAVSENTKKDIIKFLGTNEKKIEVIYHGNSLNSIKKKPIKLKIPNKYILFVGRRTGYKNFIFFLESISDLLYKRQDLYLICAGGGGIQQHERKFFEKMKISEKIIQCDFDDNALAYLYEKACLLAFPSLYEGFGIPILEAFGCNCPVVCSNTSSLPEIAKDGAKYFDPRNKQSITNALTSVLDNKDLQKDLISRGKKIEKTYSWRKTAEETYRLYRSIICL